MTDSIVFFDLGGALGREVVECREKRVAVLELYDFTHGSIVELSKSSRLGALVHEADLWTREGVLQELTRVGLMEYFDPTLILCSADQAATNDQAATYKEAREHAAEVAPVFVSVDSSRRRTARAAGLRVCPHLRFVAATLAGQGLHFARLAEGAEERCAAMASDPLLACQMLHPALGLRGGPYAILSDALSEKLGESAEILGPKGSAEDGDLVFIRQSSSDLDAAASLDAILDEKTSRLMQSENGCLLLTHDTLDVCATHLASPAHDHGSTCSGGSCLKMYPKPVPPIPARDLTPLETQDINRLSVSSISKHLAVLAGISRHYLDPGNAQASEYLCNELRRICGQAKQLKFSYLNRTLNNIEARIDGSGYGDECVVVGAHLDSVSEAAGMALGADDDASGCAAVLAIAEVLAQLPRPRRIIRFVLFNAEEARMIGSSRYTCDLFHCEPNTRVVAMLQMDMIGYVSEGSSRPYACELHAFREDAYKKSDVHPDVLIRTREIVTLVRKAADPFWLKVQLWPDDDPCQQKMATSDHLSFIRHQWPACLVTEDFFPDVCSAEKPTNPHYHKSSDQLGTIQAEYAAAIARAVAAAAWQIADADP